MVKKAKDVYRDALALSDAERDELLWLLTMRSDESTDSENIAASWLDEAERRIARYDAGQSVAGNADEVLADIERELQ